MLRQLERIDRVRALCTGDPRVIAALQYGSFVRGEGDAFSDIEFYVFLDERCAEGFDREAWARGVAPLRASLVNEYGTFVAVFDDWMRGDWHFEPPAAIERVRSWPLAPREANMLILDRDGRLAAALERDLSAEAVARFAACAATLDAASLADAYANAWRLARELANAARDAWGIDAHVAVWDAAEAELSAWLER